MKLWADRNSVTNAEQAIEALSDFFSSREGIERILAGEGDNEDFDTSQSKLNRIFRAAESGDADRVLAVIKDVRDPLAEAEALAKKWDIPFSRTMLKTILGRLDEKHTELGEWESSSYHC